MWVDHYSQFLHAHCQENATIKSALESKEDFVMFAKRFNVRVKHIHSDNGDFATKTFHDHLDACNQQQSLCGVSTHWQDGVIKRYISVITTRAHTMLLHAMQMWPNIITSEFWSFAFQHVVNICNSSPHLKEQCALYTMFTDKDDPPLSADDFWVFGSLVYVLDSSLQTGPLGPGKWKERAFQGVYIGHSEPPTSNVIMVYNPATRLVSPQYHVVHDKSFDTVQLNMSTADAEHKLEEMLDALFITSEWVHSNAYSDDIKPHTTHHYFNSSWDLAQEMIQAARPHKCMMCSCSQQEVPLSEGVSSNCGHVPMLHYVDLSVEGMVIPAHQSYQHLLQLTREQCSLTAFWRQILTHIQAHRPPLCNSLMIMLTLQLSNPA